MKWNEANLEKEFSGRLVTLRDGRQGIRGGLHCTWKDFPGTDPVMDMVASDDTVDRYNECIKQDGWQLQNFMANPVVPDCHDYSSISKVLGRDILPADQQVAGGRLGARVLFAVENPLGNLAYKMVKGGFIRSMSVGFIPLEWTNGNESGQPDRTYTKQELLEKSIVVVPANPGATIGAALKSGAIGRKDLTELHEFLKQFCSAAPDTTSRTVSAGENDVRTLQFVITACERWTR
jgi:HK97 family phage prohead protease